MGSFQNEPVMPAEAHIGYVEGYLDAIEKVLDSHNRHPDMSIQDICFALRISLRTTIVAGGIVDIPNDLTGFPSTARLLAGSAR